MNYQLDIDSENGYYDINERLHLITVVGNNSFFRASLINFNNGKYRYKIWGKHIVTKEGDIFDLIKDSPEHIRNFLFMNLDILRKL